MKTSETIRTLSEMITAYGDRDINVFIFPSDQFTMHQTVNADDSIDIRLTPLEG